jgi:hypothetical protein
MSRPQTGDPCRECSGHLVVYSGHRRGNWHIRYLQCWQCHWRPDENKIIVPAGDVQKRRSRKVS